MGGKASNRPLTTLLVFDKDFLEFKNNLQSQRAQDCTDGAFPVKTMAPRRDSQRNSCRNCRGLLLHAVSFPKASTTHPSGSFGTSALSARDEKRLRVSYYFQGAHSKPPENKKKIRGTTQTAELGLRLKEPKV